MLWKRRNAVPIVGVLHEFPLTPKFKNCILLCAFLCFYAQLNQLDTPPILTSFGALYQKHDISQTTYSSTKMLGEILSPWSVVNHLHWSCTSWIPFYTKVVQHNPLKCSESCINPTCTRFHQNHTGFKDYYESPCGDNSNFSSYSLPVPPLLSITPTCI